MMCQSHFAISTFTSSNIPIKPPFCVFNRIRSSYPNTILALTSQWDDTIKASLTREADLWCKACENSADNTFKGFSYGGCVLGGAWAVWALLLIIMDFLAAILVTALRAQDIQQLVEKEEN
jgi:hypothetical protein